MTDTRDLSAQLRASLDAVPPKEPIMYRAHNHSPYTSPRLFHQPYRAEIADLLRVMGANRRRHLTAGKWHIGELVKHTQAGLARLALLRDAADFWQPLP